MAESIRALREICQETRDDNLYSRSTFDKMFIRSASIYFTKLSLKMHISANQATFIDFLIAIASGVLMVFAEPVCWLGGIFLFYLYLVFDCVDGEVSRYNKTSWPAGSFLDGGLGWLVWPYLLACMTFGIYQEIGSITVFVFGFMATIGWLLYMACALFPYPILHSWGRLQEATTEGEEEGVAKEPVIMHLGRAFFGPKGFIPIVITVAVIDCFISPFAIGEFTLNARFIYLAIFAMATMAGIAMSTYNVIRYGVRIQRP